MVQINIIEQLNKYVFHDMPVESIELNSSSRIHLNLTTLLFNERKKEYRKLILKFNQIDKLTSEEFELDADSEIELYNFNYVYEGVFNCKLVFLLDFSKQSYTVSLQCRTIELIEL